MAAPMKPPVRPAAGKKAPATKKPGAKTPVKTPPAKGNGNLVPPFGKK